MDLGWCPVCDKHTFAIEYLYCSEACRKKDALSTIDNKCSYEFPRRLPLKPYQFPHDSPYNSPPSSPKTITGSYNFQSINYGKTHTMSSSPSELLLYGTTMHPVDSGNT